MTALHLLSMANTGGILIPWLQSGVLCLFPAAGLYFPSSALPAMEKNCCRLAHCQLLLMGFPEKHGLQGRSSGAEFGLGDMICNLLSVR